MTGTNRGRFIPSQDCYSRNTNKQIQMWGSKSATLLDFRAINASETSSIGNASVTAVRGVNRREDDLFEDQSSSAGASCGALHPGERRTRDRRYTKSPGCGTAQEASADEHLADEQCESDNEQEAPVIRAITMSIESDWDPLINYCLNI